MSPPLFFLKAGLTKRTTRSDPNEETIVCVALFGGFVMPLPKVEHAIFEGPGQIGLGRFLVPSKFITRILHSSSVKK